MLKEDVQQLTQEIEQKDDQIMTDYQSYQKKLKAKDQEIHGFQEQMKQLM